MDRILGRRGVAVLLAVVAVAVAGTAVALVVGGRERDEAARAAAERFAAAVEAGALTPEVVGDPDAPAAYAAVTAGLDAAPEVEVGEVRRDGDAATAALSWTWPYGGDGWRYTTTLPLLAAGDRWRARWSPQAVHPDLAAGDVLDASRAPAERGAVLGRDGTALVTPTPVVEVGVQPSRATDPAGLARTLGALLDVDAAALEQRVRAASPDAFVPVVVLRRTDYDPLRDRLRPLAGTVFREATLPLAPTRAFARALLGSAGPVTAEVVAESQGRLAAGDVAGLSGLQRRYDAHLGGRAGVRVERVGDGLREELFAVPPVDGAPLRLTLDPRVQTAADAALATATGGDGNASLVALDVATGDVLAVANTPVAGADRATTGRYPPGSTFKAATTLALLGTGLAPEEPVGCPPTTAVDGRSFRNFEGAALGQVPFRTAFAQSCNTAFVGLSDRVAGPALPDAARALGVGVPWSVGVDVFAGEVPVPDGPVELAAAAIGQGRTLVSPAAMAQLAATVARGSWAAPRLVVEPAPEAAPSTPPPADPTRLATVRTLLRAVVTDGTASALADVPGEPVHAKTGTAEFGEQSPPQTHAWAIGFRGGLAFAVLVEEGSSGGAVAVPVAEAFLRGLP